jgi:hypothetical protein
MSLHHIHDTTRAAGHAYAAQMLSQGAGPAQLFAHARTILGNADNKLNKGAAKLDAKSAADFVRAKQDVAKTSTAAAATSVKKWCVRLECGNAADTAIKCHAKGKHVYCSAACRALDLKAHKKICHLHK